MTPNQITTNFEQMLQLNEINMPDKGSKVFSQSGGHDILDYIITQNAKSRQTMGKDGEFEVPIIGNRARVAEVASTSIVGSDLRVNFVDTSFDKFRVKEVLTDGSPSQFQGRVKAKGAGYVILSTTPPLTAWNTTFHFVAGSFATDLYVADPNRSMAGVESLYEVPTYEKFRTSANRESLQLFENDLMQKWVDEKTGLWSLPQVDYMVQRFDNQLANKAIFSKYGKQLEVDGVTNYSEGFYEAVRHPVRGGIHRGIGNVPTYDDFIEFAGSIADRRNEAKTRLKFLVGRHALRVVQDFAKISDSVKFNGINNTFGAAKVVGYDVYNYAFAGIECELLMSSTLNNIYKFPTPSALTSQGTRMQYTMMCIDFDYRATDKGDIVPAVEKVYFGTKEKHMGVIQGIVDGIVQNNGGMGSAQASNAGTAVTLEMRSNCAYRWLPFYGGLLELNA